jgi:hypothetical protein
MEEQKRNTVPLYAAKLRDLSWHPTVTVHCICGRTSEVAVEVLWKRLPLSTPITDLHRHLRCGTCDERGAAEVDARRALGYDRHS